MDFPLRAAPIVLALLLAWPWGVQAAADPALPTEAESRARNQSVMVIGGAELTRTGHSQLPLALAQLVPSLHAPVFSSTDGSDHVSTLVANGLAPDHVLVLVNGKRRHSSALLNLSDTVGRGSMGPDLSMIPISAIDKVEVRQGSGAGRYGADAVAAVINIVLKATSTGATLDIQYGLNSGEISGVGELGGVDLDDDTVELLFAGDRNVDDGDGDTMWFSGDWGFEVGSGGFMHLSADYRDQDSTNRAGFDLREQYLRLDSGMLDPRELTVERLNHRYGQGEVEQLNIMFNASVPLSERVDVYGFGTIGSLRTNTAGDFRRAVDLRNVLGVYPNGFLPHVLSDIDDRAMVLGARGTHFDWDWDFSLSIGNNEIDWKVEQTLNTSMGPASPTSFSVGNNEISVRTTNFEVFRQLSAPVPMGVILGVETLSEEYEVEQGETASLLNGGFLDAMGNVAESGSQGFPGFSASKLEEDRDVVSGYAQIDAEFGPRTRISVSGRYDDHKREGGLVSGQVSGGYVINDETRLRASIALGSRAPELAQSFYSRTLSVFDQGDASLAGVFAADSDVAVALGGGEMREEEYTSIEFGIVMKPLPDLELSLDLYRIEVDDRVVLTQTLEGDGVVGLLENAGVQGVTSAAFFINGVDTRTQGLNLSASYLLDTAYGSLQFRLAANVNDTKVTGRSDDPVELMALGVSRFPDAGERRLEQGVPDSKAILSVDWQREKFSALLRATNYGKAADASADFELDSQLILDLSIAYQATPRVALALGANNLLDSLPDTLDEQSGTAFDQIYPFSRFSPYGMSGRFLFLRMHATLE